MKPEVVIDVIAGRIIRHLDCIVPAHISGVGQAVIDTLRELPRDDVERAIWGESKEADLCSGCANLAKDWNSPICLEQQPLFASDCPKFEPKLQGRTITGVSARPEQKVSVTYTDKEDSVFYLDDIRNVAPVLVGPAVLPVFNSFDDLPAGQRCVVKENEIDVSSFHENASWVFPPDGPENVIKDNIIPDIDQ